MKEHLYITITLIHCKHCNSSLMQSLHSYLSQHLSLIHTILPSYYIHVVFRYHHALHPDQTFSPLKAIQSTPPHDFQIKPQNSAPSSSPHDYSLPRKLQHKVIPEPTVWIKKNNSKCTSTFVHSKRQKNQTLVTFTQNAFILPQNPCQALLRTHAFTLPSAHTLNLC